MNRNRRWGEQNNTKGNEAVDQKGGAKQIENENVPR